MYVPEVRRRELDRLGCVVLDRELRSADRATVVRLTVNRHPYVLTFREPSPSQEDVYAFLDLASGDGPPLFTLCVTLDVSEPGSGWIPHRVDAFVPGDWVRDLLELSSRLDQSSRHTPSGPDDADGRTLRQRFGLT